MPFPFNAYLLAFLGSFFTTLITLPRWRKWCLRVGLVDDPGHRKIHDAPVPLAGGLAVLTGLAAPLVAGALALKFGFLGVNTTVFLSYGLSRRAAELIAILFGALGMVTLGCWDDRHELRPAAKFSGQCLIALLVAAAGVRRLFSQVLFLRSPTREKYLRWLEAEFPRYLEAYRNAYKDRVYLAGRYRERVRGMIARLKARHGFVDRDDEDHEGPPRPAEQLPLW